MVGRYHFVRYLKILLRYLSFRRRSPIYPPQSDTQHTTQTDTRTPQPHTTHHLSLSFSLYVEREREKRDTPYGTPYTYYTPTILSILSATYRPHAQRSTFDWTITIAPTGSNPSNQSRVNTPHTSRSALEY